MRTQLFLTLLFLTCLMAKPQLYGFGDIDGDGDIDAQDFELLAEEMLNFLQGFTKAYMNEDLTNMTECATLRPEFIDKLQHVIDHISLK